MEPTHYDLRVLSLGAGVQSSTVLLLALTGELPRLDACIFADTGWESRATYEHLTWLEHQADDQIPIYRVSAGHLPEQVLSAVGAATASHFGQPPFFVKRSDSEARADGRKMDRGGKLWRKCTTDYKVIPIQRKLRSLLGYKPRQRIQKQVEQWIGISTDEAHRMRDSRDAWIAHRYPLIDLNMSRADCESWLTRHGYPIPPKSSCLGCPMHNRAMWIAMRDHQPEEWRDTVEFDRRLRTGKLPHVTGDAYLHYRMMPLAEAVEATHPSDQLDLFGNECEGLCGT